MLIAVAMIVGTGKDGVLAVEVTPDNEDEDAAAPGTAGDDDTLVLVVVIGDEAIAPGKPIIIVVKETEEGLDTGTAVLLLPTLVSVRTPGLVKF